MDNLCVPIIACFNCKNMSLWDTWWINYLIESQFSRLIRSSEEVSLPVKFISENHSSSITTMLSRNSLTLFFYELSGFLFISILLNSRYNTCVYPHWYYGGSDRVGGTKPSWEHRAQLHGQVSLTGVVTKILGPQQKTPY